MLNIHSAAVAVIALGDGTGMAWLLADGRMEVTQGEVGSYRYRRLFDRQTLEAGYRAWKTTPPRDGLGGVKVGTDTWADYCETHVDFGGEEVEVVEGFGGRIGLTVEDLKQLTDLMALTEERNEAFSQLNMLDNATCKLGAEGLPVVEQHDGATDLLHSLPVTAPLIRAIIAAEDAWAPEVAVNGFTFDAYHVSFRGDDLVRIDWADAASRSATGEVHLMMGDLRGILAVLEDETAH